MGMRTVEEDEEIEDVPYEDVSHDVATQVEEETASSALDFDAETGEIHESSGAPAESSEAPTAEQVQAPF